MPNSLENRRCSFIFTTLLVHTMTPKISTKNPFFYFSHCHFRIAPLLVHRVILTNPTKTHLLYTSSIFHLPIFAYQHSNILHQKHFPYLNHLANSGCDLISPFFFKVWTMIAGLRMTNSL